MISLGRVVPAAVSVWAEAHAIIRMFLQAMFLKTVFWNTLFFEALGVQSSFRSSLLAANSSDWLKRGVQSRLVAGECRAFREIL
jgi:hypothetical protein